MIGDLLFWPFSAAYFGVKMIVGILLLIFWIWMIVDVVQRKFKNQTEKVLWIVGVILLNWVGALVYYIVIRALNPIGLAKKK